MEYKIRRSLTNNSFIERRRAIFLVGVVCLLVFFMTTFASALTWEDATIKSPKSMSDDTTPSPFVTTSSSSGHSGKGAWGAFDGVENIESDWGSTEAAGMPQWIAIDFGSGNNFIATNMTNRGVPAGTVVPKDYTFAGSADNITWELLYNVVGEPLVDANHTYNFTANTNSYRYYNWTFLHGQSSDSFVSIRELTIWGYAIPGLSITLDSPSNNTALSDTGTNFSTYGNVTSSFNATNITYYIWDASDDSIFNQSTVVLDGNASFFNESLFIDNFTLGNYIWNVKACWENSTYSNCSFATNNFTFNVVPASVLSESYSSVVLEGDASLFTINMSIITTDRLTSATLVYNGTSYSASATEYATNTWFLSYTHNIPEIDATENVTFYWNIKLESGFGYNSTSHNQTIVQIAIDDCSSYTFQMFNFTLVDEKDQTLINGATENTSIKIDMSLSYADGSGEIIQFFQNYTKVNPGRVCMETAIGNSTLRMDAVIEYSSAARFVEFYNIQNFTFTNATGNQTILLYNLKESEGQEFKITYKGQDFIPVTNLIIQIQRKYIEEGVFKTIEIPMSGSSGYTIAHLVPNDVVYNLAFIKNGVVLDLFTEVIANCQNPTITECEINLNALITGDNLINLVTESDFWSSLTFNKTSRVVRATYGIVSGVSSVVQLNVSLVDNFGNQTVCSDSLNAAGGTLSCTVPASFGNSTIYATITYDGDVRREGYISLKQSPKDQYAGVIIFASIILLLFIFGIGISDNPTITGIFLILGSMLLVGLNLVYTSSWVGAGASILWFIIAVLIVIIKGGSKR